MSNLLLLTDKLTARSGLTVLSNRTWFALLQVIARCHRASFCLSKTFFLASVPPYAHMTLNQSERAGTFKCGRWLMSEQAAVTRRSVNVTGGDE